MKRKQLGAFALGALAFASLMSCDLSYFDGEIQEISWDGAIAAPLGYVEYSVSELFQDISSDDLDISTNQEDVVTFVFTQDFEAEGTEIVKIENQNFSLDFEIPGDPFPAPEQRTDVFDFDRELYLAPISDKNEELTRAYFNGGTLSISVSTNIDVENTIQLTIPSFKRISDDSSIMITATSDGSSPSAETSEFDLADLYADFSLTSSGEASFNTILMEVYAEFVKEVGDQVSDGSFLEFQISLNNAESRLTYGDFKDQEITVNAGDMEFDVFDSFGDGELIFADPEIRMNFDNSYGIPMGIDLSGIKGENATETIRLSGEVTESYQVINAPVPGEEGDFVSTEIVINNTNSNLSELMSSKPSLFIVDLGVVTNPQGTPSAENFVMNTSEIISSVEVEIPMAVTFGDIPIEQEFDLDLDQSTSGLEALLIKIESTNSMPMGGTLMIEFLDSSGNTILSTDRTQVFDAAPVDANGMSNGETMSKSEFEFDAADSAKITSASMIKVTAYLNTTDASSGQVVKLVDTNTLRLDLSMLINLNL